MTQARFAEWLGCSKHAVISWEIGRNTIPDWVKARIRSDRPTLNPTLSLEQFRLAQDAAQKAGKSLEDWIADLIKAAVKLILWLCLLAKLMSDPTDWSAEALAGAAAQGCIWFGQGLYVCASIGWNLFA